MRSLLVLGCVTWCLALGCAEGPARCVSEPACDEASSYLEEGFGFHLSVVHRSVAQTSTLGGCQVKICERSGFELLEFSDLARVDTEEELALAVADDVVGDRWSVLIDGDDVVVGMQDPDVTHLTVCVRDLETRPACVQAHRGTQQVVVLYEKNSETPITTAGDSGERILIVNVD